MIYRQQKTIFCNNRVSSTMSEDQLTLALQEIAARFIINQPDFIEESEISVFDLLINFKEAYWHYSDFVKTKLPSKQKLNFTQFVSSICAILPPLAPYKNFLPKEINHFNSDIKHLPVAGVICFNADKTKVIGIRDASPSKTFGFPKGKIAEGESIAEAAIRETIEEIGIDVSPYFKENQYKEFNFKKKVYHFFYVVGIPEDFDMITIHRNEISTKGWYNVSQLRSERCKSKIAVILIDWIEKISQSKD